MAPSLKSCFSKILPLFDQNGQRVTARCWCCQMAKSMLSWSWIATILLVCSFWTSLSPSILSRMIWNASRGTIDEVEALLLLPLLLNLEVYPTAFASVSIRLASPWSPSSSSPGRRTCILMMVILLMAEGVDIGLISWGIAMPFALKSLMRRLGKINLGLEVVLLSSTIVSNIWELMSMKVFSLSSTRKIALALLIVVSLVTGYKLNIMMVVRHLMSTGNAIVLRHLPFLCPPMWFWTVSIDSILSL